jgi:hypothetical protein
MARHINALESVGYSEIMGGVRDAWDPGDQFASVQEWRFAICELLLHDFGHCVPGFRTMQTEPDMDDFAVDYIRALYVIEDDSIAMEYWHYEEDMKRVLVVLDRYREWLRIAGEDY